MNRTTAIILTLVSVLLCGCPGLFTVFTLIYSFFVSPEQAYSSLGITAPSGDLTPYMWVARLLFLLIALVLVLIPVVVGVLTLRKRKQPSI
jgi:hypothetical protein